MRLLWDLRLFSYGYARRGIGRYTHRMLSSIMAARPPAAIFVWGDRSRVPDDIAAWPVTWIPYRGGDWKHDLLAVPAIILKHNIDIFHYWVALGPLRQMGMGLFHPCEVCATVYDLGVELWNDVPFLASVRAGRYWHAQRRLVGQSRRVVCISRATQDDLTACFPSLGPRSRVIYVPLVSGLGRRSSRQPYFVTLGGAVNKNARAVVAAFSLLQSKRADAALLIMGDIDKEEELPGGVPPGVRFEGMDRYEEHLSRAAGLVFCSTHEGLGLPPIEAMHYGCPLLLADIPVLRETCDGAGYFARPDDPSSIAAGMAELLDRSETWADRSAAGALRWKDLSHNARSRWLGIYEELMRRRRRE